jgi:cysteine-rich repeat protein
MRGRYWLLSSVAVLALGIFAMQCGSPAVCGDGKKEGDEECDNGLDNGTMGNGCSGACKLVAITRTQLRVRVSRLKDEVPGYGGATCSDLMAAKTRIALAGPSSMSVDWPCTKVEDLYENIPAGTYQVTATMLDASDTPITMPVKSMMIDVQVRPTETSVTINFKPGDFIKNYIGRYDFNTNWGATNKGCNDVTPQVVTQALWMARPGMTTPIAGMTVSGLKLDGTQGPCFVKGGGASYQSIDNLDWGHYDLVVTGRSPGSPGDAWCKKFDIFVGPGTSNPTFELVVDPASTDGGVACP